jgi:peptidylprolyl isomerase
MGSLPIITQPDAQMFVTADFKVGASGLFCPGVAGMARAGSPDSANSQFFLMTGQNDNLNGGYTTFGRVVQGLDVVKALKAGSDAEDGKVADPDVMTKVQLASALPEGQRPTVRVAVPGSPAFNAAVEAARTARGAQFGICDVQPVVEVTGG